MVPATLEKIRYEVDVNTMRKKPLRSPMTLGLNSIARVKIVLHRQLAFDAFNKNHATGAFILIDRLTNATVAAGMILDKRAAEANKSDDVKSTNISSVNSLVSADDRARLLGHRPKTLWLTGLSGSGKSTIAKALEKRLVDSGKLAFILDGDNVRYRLNRDLGFSDADRAENIRRISEVARLMNDAGIIVITAFISPFAADREMARENIRPEFFTEIFIDTPLEVCEQRDPKGLYKKARSGEIKGFTGIEAPYEPPTAPDLTVKTSGKSVDECVDEILKILK